MPTPLHRDVRFLVESEALQPRRASRVSCCTSAREVDCARMETSPVWKRVLGGVAGLAIVVAVLLVARSRGVSGAEMEQWEEIFVFSAIAASGIVWLMRRRYRQKR